MACLGFVDCFHSAGDDRARENLSSQLFLLSFGGICLCLCFVPESHVLVSVCPACLFLSSQSLVPPLP